MHDDDEALALLERTPADVPMFDPGIEAVVRRAGALRRCRVAGRFALGAMLLASVAAPLFALSGFLGGGPAVIPGSGGKHPVRLIQWYEPSGSMEPTVGIGDVVLIDMNAYQDGRFPETGDVVLFWWKTGGDRVQILKRVIGLPGQTVEIHDGVVIVDGRALEEPYLKGTGDGRNYGPYVVPEGHLFVLGDNRPDSNDSRFAIGPVPVSEVVGKMVGLAAPGDRHVEPPAAATAATG